VNTTPHTKSNWAVFIVGAVIVIFGFFWVWQKNQILDQSTPIAPPPVETGTRNTSPTPTTSYTLDPRDLEASAVNISIPSFDSVF